MNEQRPSMARILFTDYAASFSVIVILVTVGFFLYDRFFAASAFTNWMPLIVAGIVTAGLAAIVWRIRLISSAFEYGWDVEGEISAVSFFRDRGRVTYIYSVEGQRYESSNAVMLYSRTRSLQRGQKVRIVANREKPRVAFLRDLYL